jgi:tetratricopeptide (TPR) repeat protein
MTVPLADAPGLLNDIYRLQPDRRFLLAVAEVHRLFDGKREKTVRVAFSEGQWAIQSDGESVGSVPDLATYPDMTRALSEWAARLNARSAWKAAAPLPDADRVRIEGMLGEFLAPKPIEALGEIDRLWSMGLRDPALVGFAGRAFVRLSLQSLDRVQMADRLPGRAMAFLVFSESFGAAANPVEHALLASLMGYETDAAQIAEKISANHPVRLFAKGQGRALLERVQTNQADRLGQYLGLLTVAGHGKKAWGHWGRSELWSDWFEKYFFDPRLTLPVLRSAIEVDQFETRLPLSNAILHEVMLAVAPAARRTEEETRVPRGLTEQMLQEFIESVRAYVGFKPQGLVQRFEDAVASKSPSNATFWEAESFRAYFRGYFYSALFTLGYHYADSLASGPAAGEFAEYLKGAPGGVGVQFARWYGDLVSLRYGTGLDPKRLIEDFTSLEHVGPPALAPMLTAIDSYLLWDNELTPGVMRPFVRKLDARIANRSLLVRPAFYPLQDLNLATKLCRDLVARAPLETVGYRAWCTDFLGDERGLLALIDRSELDLETRSAALSLAVEKGRLSDAIIRRRYRKFLQESDYDRLFTAPYLEYLENQAEDFREARRVVEEFLSRHTPEDGLLYSIYRGRLAHLMELQGDYAGAWAVVEPELASGQGAVMGWGASILQRLGRREEAISLARRTVERYPDSPGSRGHLAEILWRERRYSDAALVLERPEMSLFAWRSELAQSFYRAFRDREERDAIEAFDPLVAQKITRFHLQLLFEPFASKRPSLAFALQSRLKRPYVMDIVGPRFLAYMHLKAWKGEEEALRWLHDNIPQNMREVGTFDFYNEQEFDLLWTLVEPPAGKELSPRTWLLRAAAAVYRGLDRDPQRQALLAHYSESRPDFDHALGRYLLGLESATGVERLARDGKQRSEAAYFFGIRALSEGRIPEAADWLRVVVETEPAVEVMMLARRALTRWSERGRSPEVIEGKIW